MEDLEQEKGTFTIKCSLGEVGFKVITLSIPGLAKVKLFLQDTLDGCEFNKELQSRIRSAWLKSGRDPSLLESPLFNSLFNLVYGRLIRERRLNLDTLDYSSTFREITEFANLQNKSKLEKMLAIADRTTDPTEELLRRAIFTEPDFSDSRLDEIAYRLGFYLGFFVSKKEEEKYEREDNCAKKILQEVDYLYALSSPNLKRRSRKSLMNSVQTYRENV